MFNHQSIESSDVALKETKPQHFSEGKEDDDKEDDDRANDDQDDKKIEDDDNQNEQAGRKAKKVTSVTGTRDSFKRTARIAGLNECNDGKQSSERAEGGTKSAGQLSKKAKQLTSLPSRSRPVFKNPKKMTFQRRKNSISSNSSDEVDSSQSELRQYVPVFQLGSLFDTLQVTRSYLRMTAQ